jgi:hypothetical protein
LKLIFNLEQDWEALQYQALVERAVNLVMESDEEVIVHTQARIVKRYAEGKK